MDTPNFKEIEKIKNMTEDDFYNLTEKEQDNALDTMDLYVKWLKNYIDN